MREFRIINSACDREGELVPGEVLTKKIWEESFPDISTYRLRRFVRRMKNDGGSKFCVSNVDGLTTIDPNLMFFKVESQGENKAKIIFVGKGNIGGSIAVVNQFAAETWGYWVLKPNPEELR